MRVGDADGKVRGPDQVVQPRVGGGDLLPLGGALGQHLAGVRVRRGEVEHGARQAGSAERGRRGETDAVKVLVEDDAAGGRVGELHVPGQPGRDDGADHADLRVRPGAGPVRVGARHEFLQQAPDQVVRHPGGLGERRPLPVFGVVEQDPADAGPKEAGVLRGGAGSGGRTGAAHTGGRVLGLDRHLQQELDHEDPVAVPGRDGHRTGPLGRQAQRPPLRRGHHLSRRAGGGLSGEHRTHQGRREQSGAAAGQAQHRVQRGPARGRDLLGVLGQPGAGRGRVGSREVLEEHAGRPHPAGRGVGQQQVRRVLLEDRQPGGGGAGAEEKRGGTRVGPPGQLQRVRGIRALEGGEFQDPGGAAGQRHQQLTGRGENLGVQAGRSARLGHGTVQGARRRAVHRAPHVQRRLLGDAELHPHQALGDPHGPAPVVAARPGQLPAQHLGRRAHPLPRLLNPRDAGGRERRRAGRGTGGGRRGGTGGRPARLRDGVVPAGRSAADGNPRGRDGVHGVEQACGRGLQAHRNGRSARQAQQRVRRAAQTRLRDLSRPLQNGAGQDPARITQQPQRPHTRLTLRAQRRGQDLIDIRQFGPALRRLGQSGPALRRLGQSGPASRRCLSAHRCTVEPCARYSHPNQTTHTRRAGPPPGATPATAGAAARRQQGAAAAGRGGSRARRQQGAAARAGRRRDGRAARRHGAADRRPGGGPAAGRGATAADRRRRTGGGGPAARRAGGGTGRSGGGGTAGGSAAARRATATGRRGGGGRAARGAEADRRRRTGGGRAAARRGGPAAGRDSGGRAWARRGGGAAGRRRGAAAGPRRRQRGHGRARHGGAAGARPGRGGGPAAGRQRGGAAAGRRDRGATGTRRGGGPAAARRRGSGSGREDRVGRFWRAPDIPSSPVTARGRLPAAGAAGRRAEDRARERGGDAGSSVMPGLAARVHPAPAGRRRAGGRCGPGRCAGCRSGAGGCR
ncbi:hypothetical protein [Streptomyces marianii]|uniref:hypothetical protein n=1 Tax=Streptomyces marianii TaxID=1817406 RepID=UPI001486B6B3|nr:hypothetical protein [Streptomyces marianii]